jgi:D-alanyl-D-alanine carboxypeptidase
MPTRFRTTAAAVLSCAAMLGAAGAPAAVAAPASVAAPRAAALQRDLDAVAAGGATAALAQVRDGRMRWRGGAGVARLGTQQRVRPDGAFRIGSVTKSFVATVVLQLVGEGKLALDAPLERYLPGLLPYGASITVRQVLDHTAGIPDYFGPLYGNFGDPAVMRAWVDHGRWRTYTLPQLVGFVAAQPQLPTGRWSYSNTGYAIAGMLIERATGRSYADEIRTRILRPLGLRHTSLPGTSTRIPGPHAHSYILVPPSTTPDDITEQNPSAGAAAYDMISTTDDLGRFFSALLAGRLLRPAQLAAMKTVVPTPIGVDYGLGLVGQPLPCHMTVWGHEGFIAGSSTKAYVTADGRRQAVVTFNGNPDQSSSELAEAPARAVEKLLADAFCPGR